MERRIFITYKLGYTESTNPIFKHKSKNKSRQGPIKDMIWVRKLRGTRFLKVRNELFRCYYLIYYMYHKSFNNYLILEFFTLFMRSVPNSHFVARQNWLFFGFWCYGVKFWIDGNRLNMLLLLPLLLMITLVFPLKTGECYNQFLQ